MPRLATVDQPLVFTEDGRLTPVWRNFFKSLESLPLALPGARLTLVSGTPVMTSTVALTTSAYITPLIHGFMPIYDGQWSVQKFDETLIDLTTGTAGVPNDVFYYGNPGGIGVELVGWASATTRSVALSRQDGVPVKATDPTKIFAGTIALDGSYKAQWKYGTVDAGGGAAQFDVWNYYNRRSVSTCVKDSTDSWTYSTATWRAYNNSSTNRVTFVCGVKEDSFAAQFNAAFYNTSGGAAVGIGYDSTTAFSGTPSFTSSGYDYEPPATFKTTALGQHYVSGIEYCYSTTATFLGDSGIPLVIQSGLWFEGWF